MKLCNSRVLRLLAVPLLALDATGFAQTVTPTPVIKITSQTVLLDVIVQDHHGDAVKGLKKEDFTILDEGVPQPISYFEVHAGAQPFIGSLPKLPEGMYSNFPTEIKSDAVNVILLDSLNTPMKDQMTVRKQMISYLKAIPPGTRIAIFTLASHLRMVNGFTTDPSVLLAALNQPGKKGIDSSPLLISPDDQQAQDKRQDQFLSTGELTGPNSTPEQRQAVLSSIDEMRQFVSDEASFNDDLRVKMTLQAMDQLARYLSPLPGRKNLIWFSGSFPIGVDPDYGQLDAYRMMRDYALAVRATAQRLATERVAVYPIDARRFISNNPMQDASIGGESSLRNPDYANQAADRAFKQVTSEHDTMDSLAEDTGGHAIYNTGDLKGAMADVIANGDRYYTLAFDPVNVKRDGKFHKITVKFDLPGYKLLYRHGYVAEDEKASAATQKQPDKEQRPNVFRAEMAPGGPPASEILFRIQELAEPQQPSAKDKLKGDNPALQRPITRYVFGYTVGVDAAQLTTTPDGIRHGLLLTMAIAYDSQGRPLNSVLNTEKLDLDPKVYADALREGLPFYQELDIPPGQATVRVGIYDVTSKKMGAMEFPLTVSAPPK